MNLPEGSRAMTVAELAEPIAIKMAADRRGPPLLRGKNADRDRSSATSCARSSPSGLEVIQVPVRYQNYYPRDIGTPSQRYAN